jgi:hypothetical protein
VLIRIEEMSLRAMSILSVTFHPRTPRGVAHIPLVVEFRAQAADQYALSEIFAPDAFRENVTFGKRMNSILVHDPDMSSFALPAGVTALELLSNMTANRDLKSSVQLR